MPLTDVITLIVAGLAAGLLGGLLGIGGSIIMIPVLTLLLGRDQHLSQAAAMIINVFVAIPALLRHRRAGAVDWTVVRRMLPAGLVLIVVGVEVSNVLAGKVLERIFGVFLLYVILVNIRKLVARGGAEEGADARRGWVASSTVGSITGFAAGLLGIGGGVIAVPLLQRINRLALRNCIACSTALMCITAVVGAARKNLTLGDLTDAAGATLDWHESLLIAACLAPTAIIGGHLGAGLTHTLPLKWLRILFVVLLAAACFKFLF